MPLKCLFVYCVVVIFSVEECGSCFVLREKQQKLSLPGQLLSLLLIRYTQDIQPYLQRVFSTLFCYLSRGLMSPGISSTYTLK